MNCAFSASQLFPLWRGTDGEARCGLPTGNLSAVFQDDYLSDLPRVDGRRAFASTAARLTRAGANPSRMSAQRLIQAGQFPRREPERRGRTAIPRSRIGIAGVPSKAFARRSAGPSTPRGSVPPRFVYYKGLGLAVCRPASHAQSSEAESLGQRGVAAFPRMREKPRQSHPGSTHARAYPTPQVGDYYRTSQQQVVPHHSPFP